MKRDSTTANDNLIASQNSLINFKGTKKKTVLAFGTFDILHPGHLFYLKQAKKHGEYLIVVIARDSTVERLRGRKPLFGERDRQALVGALSVVDQVVLGGKCNHLAILATVGPDVICLGYDQKADINAIRDILVNHEMQASIIRVKSYKKMKYKSSFIKKTLQS